MTGLRVGWQIWLKERVRNWSALLGCSARTRGNGVIRMSFSLAPLAVALLLLTGCNKEKAAMEAAAGAEALLKQGDLPGAAAAYDAALTEYPRAPDVVTGAAYMALLAGNAARADELLAGLEAEAADKLGEVKLRRALVALRQGDLEKTREHATASNLPAGKLLAAEVALADGDRDAARGLLGEAKAAGGDIAGLADDYVLLLDDADPNVAGLAEVQALWALGVRRVAVKSAEGLVLNLPDSRSDRDAQALLWAGRAASEREAATARALLGGVIFPPEGQAWRKVATEAIVSCLEGDTDTCTGMFQSLEGVAPSDGLADARATAAWLIAESNPEVAATLAGPYATNASARALLQAGRSGDAAGLAPAGVFASYLKGGS